ncbi:MAG: serine hydrolase domain-containing protein [Bdellovibrionota bacterium]|mgnify:CR=1 FL=1
MNYRIFTVALLLSISFSLFAAETTLEKIDQAVQLQIEKNFIPGAVIGLYENGKITYASYGETQIGSGHKPTEHSIYEIGSISKVFTGIILASLHNKKIVNLNDPISKYIPELKNYPTGQITLVELSTHTSGLPRLPRNFKPANVKDPYADYTEKLLIEYLISVSELTRPTPFSWNNYSNLGVGLLGHILTIATNKSYEQLLQELITTPLNMPSTVVTLNEFQKTQFATPYNDYLGVTLPWNLNVLVGAGGIRSTASDLMSFLMANKNPENTSISENLKLAQSVHAQNGDARIGLGWGIETDYRGHSGGTGGFRSEIILSTDGKKALVTLVNSANQIQCIKTIFLTSSACKPNIGYELTTTELKERAGTYVAKTLALSFVIEQRNNFLTYEIPGQEIGRLNAKSLNLFDIQGLAQIEFIKNSTTGLIDKMKFTQGAISLELEKK